jgi:hypothetical protein
LATPIAQLACNIVAARTSNRTVRSPKSADLVEQ